MARWGKEKRIDSLEALNLFAPLLRGFLTIFSQRFARMRKFFGPRTVAVHSGCAGNRKPGLLRPPGPALARRTGNVAGPRGWLPCRAGPGLCLTQEAGWYGCHALLAFGQVDYHGVLVFAV